MLAWAGLGVAVANAHPAVPGRGEVAPATTDDGVAFTLERLASISRALTRGWRWAPGVTIEPRAPGLWLRLLAGARRMTAAPPTDNSPRSTTNGIWTEISWRCRRGSELGLAGLAMRLAVGPGAGAALRNRGPAAARAPATTSPAFAA